MANNKEQLENEHPLADTNGRMTVDLTDITDVDYPYISVDYKDGDLAILVDVSIVSIERITESGQQIVDQFGDIIDVITLGSPEKMCAFCRGIQAGSPIDSFVSPVPSPMPGYDSDVIMAAGAFTLGSSIEMSADGPIREPYAVYLQGGLSFATAKVSVMLAAQEVEKN